MRGSKVRGLSFDISRKSTGIAYWEGGNAVKVSAIKLPEGSLGMQLHLWDAALKELLHNYRPDYIAYEDARAVSKQHGMILFGMTGILLKYAHERNVHAVGFAQTTVKKALTGYGAAKKPQMLAAAQERWPELGVTSDDEADALGVGLAFIDLVGIEQLAN